MTAGNFEWTASAYNVLGSGSFGTVYLGRDKPSQARIAIKVYYDPNGTSSNTEIAMYQQLRDAPQPSPFLQCYGLAGRLEDRLQSLALELACSGDLHHYLKNNGPSDELYREVFFGRSDACTKALV